MRVLRYGQRGVLVEVERPEQVLGLHSALEGAPPRGVVEMVPAALTVLVRYDPALTDADRLAVDLARYPDRGPAGGRRCRPRGADAL